MTDAEIFLMVWAVLATVVAGIFTHKANQHSEAVRALFFAITEIAEGKAEVTISGDTVKIKKLKD